VDVDVAVVGGGGAGLTVLLALDSLGVSGLSVALVDPVHRRGADRTWCFWDAGRSDVEDAVFRAWRTVDVVRADGRVLGLDLHPLRYVMVRSADFYHRADGAAERLGVVRVPAAATSVVDGVDRAVVSAEGQLVAARWVLDSRPATPARAPRTSLLQHFRGWTVRAEAASFDPDRAVLMDFRTPQPACGMSFGYVLPHDATTALVEYTEFSRRRLDEAGYEERLGDYVRRRVGGVPVEVVDIEDGAIPMTDAGYARRAGRRVVRLGSAGGATRGSTGYAFAAMLRQARWVAAALRDGRDPMPPRAYPRRHRWMDAVLLRAIDRGLVDGPDVFAGLFARHPAERVLRFLDGATSPAEEMAIMASTPLGPMTRAAAGDAAARIRARTLGLGRRTVRAGQGG
jgi:lycopene beta-cyclase